MTFKIKESRNFNNSGIIYTAPVVSRKLNGYNVVNAYGEIAFLCDSDIDILYISDYERTIPIEF